MRTLQWRTLGRAGASIGLAALFVGGWIQAGLAGEWRDGTDVYRRVCAYCHETGVGPKILGRHLPPAYVQKTVRNGYRAMPAFRPSEIDDRLLGEVADFVGQ